MLLHNFWHLLDYIYVKELKSNYTNIADRAATARSEGDFSFARHDR